jgi:transposase
VTEKVLMGKKEITGSHVMEQVKAGGMTLKEAAAQLRMGYRQAKRDCRRYKAEGAAGLPRRNQGKPSNSGINRETKESAIKAYRRRHEGFGPAFAAGKLAEHEGITVNAETLRLWLTGEGLWKRRGRDNPHRNRRGRGGVFWGADPV